MVGALMEGPKSWAELVVRILLDYSGDLPIKLPFQVVAPLIAG